MKNCIALIGCFALLAFLVGCERRPVPLKQGVIWKVVWSPQPNEQTGLYREKMPAHPEFAGGEYGVDMSGRLYPGFLEVDRVGSQDSHSQIIPLRQIIWLEFGDGGVSVTNH
jgi:hypothetical protein